MMETYISMTYVIERPQPMQPFYPFSLIPFPLTRAREVLTYDLRQKQTGEEPMFSQINLNKPLPKITDIRGLLEVLEHAESYCKNCETVSPMICVERCDMWRVKNEISEIRRIVNQKDHAVRLLNVLKNERRLGILDALMESSRSLKELQEYLKKRGYRHSRSTLVNAYVKPLLDTGLIKKEGTRYRFTFYGKNFHGILKGVFLRDLLPIHSCCYEEVVLRELKPSREPLTNSQHWCLLRACQES
jgi:hypothetical protein